MVALYVMFQIAMYKYISIVLILLAKSYTPMYVLMFNPIEFGITVMH